MSFTRPSAKQISEALGDINQLPREMQLAVTRRLDDSFKPVPKPRSDDWLAEHPEKGQSMKSFERQAFKAVPHGSFKTIFIQPVGSFDHIRAPPLTTVIEFTKAFFAGCDVELLQPIDFTADMVHRNNGGVRQYHTDGFFKLLAGTRNKRAPRRELVSAAVTMSDIYPENDWNFVYGLAEMVDGLGVYSFARLDPLFQQPPEVLRNTPLSDEHRTIMLRRCIKILLHELGHLFGLRHCIYYVCLMNGANHEREMDSQPLYLCPVCLRKLYSTMKFDVRALYTNFMQLCEKYGFEEERQWYLIRLQSIEDST